MLPASRAIPSITKSLSYFPKGRPRRLFERGGPGEPIYVSDEFGLKPNDDRLKAVRADASVVATLDLLNVPLAMRIAESHAIGPVVEQYHVSHGKWEPSTKTIIDMFEQNPELRGLGREAYPIQRPGDSRLRY